MLRLKLKLIKSAPAVKVETQEIGESEKQVIEGDEKECLGSQDDRQDNFNEERV